jgi:peptidoglycan-associated lipoprotein
VCNNNVCVECNRDSDCPNGDACNNHQCTPTCTSNSDCSGTTPICDTNNNTCVECNHDSDCPNGGSCDSHQCH